MELPRFAVLRNELRILRRDQAIFIALVALPLVLIGFFKPVFRVTLQSEGFRSANGTEQAVPGMAVAFAFFIVGNVGFVFFREHGWGTWERLRASAASTAEIVASKIVPLMLVVVAQQAVLFGFGCLFLGLRVRGSLLALSLVGVALAFALVAFGLAVTAIFSRIEQVNLVQTVGGMLLAGFGGALAPTVLLPGWAQAIGKVTPSYWAISGYRDVILMHAGLADVAMPVFLLVATGVVFVAVAMRFFRVEESKAFWA